MPAPLDQLPSPDSSPDEQIINVVRPDDALGATPRWVVADQQPVSRFEAGDPR